MNSTVDLLQEITTPPVPLSTDDETLQVSQKQSRLQSINRFSLISDRSNNCLRELEGSEGYLKGIIRGLENGGCGIGSWGVFDKAAAVVAAEGRVDYPGAEANTALDNIGT
ncbi:Uncharacterized protein Fot_30923 [Forsythia ovata]|uniref:Uncharacterized protein n=1 Tax=Forsythia ovata TaxID=205694 RepID=A0ABD1T3I6_9LAMI